MPASRPTPALAPPPTVDADREPCVDVAVADTDVRVEPNVDGSTADGRAETAAEIDVRADGGIRRADGRRGARVRRRLQGSIHVDARIAAIGRPRRRCSRPQ